MYRNRMKLIGIIFLFMGLLLTTNNVCAQRDWNDECRKAENLYNDGYCREADSIFKMIDRNAPDRYKCKDLQELLRKTKRCIEIESNDPIYQEIRVDTMYKDGRRKIDTVSRVSIKAMRNVEKETSKNKVVLNKVVQTKLCKQSCLIQLC